MDISNYRGISILDPSQKILGSIMDKKLSSQSSRIRGQRGEKDQKGCFQQLNGCDKLKQQGKIAYGIAFKTAFNQTEIRQIMSGYWKQESGVPMFTLKKELVIVVKK